MDDPIQGHPTRAEQLDILATLVADQARPGDRILDLGCGTGYVAHLICEKRRDLAFVGLDINEQSLEAASDNLGPYGVDARFVAADLSDPSSIDVAVEPHRFVLTALTFHDLTDDQKQQLLAWACDRLADDGFLLIYDRIRLTDPALFPLQQSLWSRIEREHGRGMRAAADYAAYQADLGPKNQPAALADYGKWLRDLGLQIAPLHLHGNVMLLGAARGA